jgi:hypothetical protein
MSTKRIFAVAVGAAFLALLAGGITGCGSSTSSQPPGTTHSFTSTMVNSHTHTVTIDKADVQTPPAAGISETTSSASGHTHSFDMTQAQLTTVMGGGSVTITSGSSATTGVHTHDFTVTKWF